MLRDRFTRHLLTAFAVLALSPGLAGAQTAATDTGLSPRQVLIRLTSAAGAGSGVSNIGEAIADRESLEQGFGVDLQHVRVHSGSAAQAACEGARPMANLPFHQGHG